MQIVGIALVLFFSISQAQVTKLNQWIKSKVNSSNGIFFYHNEWASAGGPSKWNLTFPDCGLNAQSPINIQRSSVIKKRASLVMNYFNKEVISVKMQNTGHALGMSLKFIDDINNTLYWSENNQTYHMDSIHIHWGPPCGGGSEHLIEGHRFSAELHIVHHNTKYKSQNEAVTMPDGLAVVAVLFELEEQSLYNASQNKFAKFVKYLTKVEYSFIVHNKTELFNVRDIIKSEIKDYYSYHGSLTTPPCYESVQWFVAKETIRMFPSEIEELRRLREDKFNQLSTNYRPIQAMNGRSVYEFYE